MLLSFILFILKILIVILSSFGSNLVLRKIEDAAALFSSLQSTLSEEEYSMERNIHHMQSFRELLLRQKAVAADQVALV